MALNWQDNSKAMFDKLIEGSPKPFRAMTEKKMMEGLTKKAGDSGNVTEDMVAVWVRQVPVNPLS